MNMEITNRGCIGARPLRFRMVLPALLMNLFGMAAAAAAATPTTVVGFAPLDSLPLPPGVVTGMSWKGPDTLAVLIDLPDSLSEDGRPRMLLSYQDAAGVVLHQEDFTGTLARGLTYDGEFLWSCGDETDGASAIFKIDPDTLNVEEAFATPGHAPSALCFDGRNIWISDRDAGRIDRLDPETGKITRSVTTPGFSPFGMAWDGRYLWLTDSGTGRLYRLVGSRRVWNATVDTASFAYRGRDVLLLHDGRSLWYLPQGESQAVRVSFY